MSGAAHEPDATPVPRGKRILYAVAGWTFLCLGVAGTVLPLLPTTPFLILALWAFSRSSQRMADWLYHHPRFGPPLRAWRRHRVIPLHAKLLAWTMMAATLAYAIFVARMHPAIVAVMAALMAVGVVYVATKPSRRPADAEAEVSS